MKARLIKAGMLPPPQKEKQPPDEILASDDTLRSWVHEFKSNKANKVRLDYRRLGNLRKR